MTLSHSNLMAQVSAYPKLKVWNWLFVIKEWVESDLDTMIKRPDDKFAVGDKPTDPPARMCKMGGIEFPEPLCKRPEKGSIYWIAGLEGISFAVWDNDSTDVGRLENKLCHKDADGAHRPIPGTYCGPAGRSKVGNITV